MKARWAAECYDKTETRDTYSIMKKSNHTGDMNFKNSKVREKEKNKLVDKSSNKQLDLRVAGSTLDCSSHIEHSQVNPTFAGFEGRERGERSTISITRNRKIGS